MRSDPLVWLLRAVWLSLPFTVGDALGRALDGRSSAVVVVVAVLAWAIWLGGLVASMVTIPAAHAAIRGVAPIAPAASLVLLFVESPHTGDAAGTSVLGVVGLVSGIVAAAIAWSGVVADAYASGSAYGDEARFALRVPVPFAMGPIPIFWAATVGGLIVGPILLAAKNWVLGALLSAIGAAVAYFAVRSFYALSRRWIVFVPAGMTLVDHLSLSDPVLFSKARIARFGPAYEGTTAKDLTQNTAGLVMEVAFDMQLDISMRTGRDAAEVELVRSVLISPVRPGAVMDEAKRRGINATV